MGGGIAEGIPGAFACGVAPLLGAGAENNEASTSTPVLDDFPSPGAASSLVGCIAPKGGGGTKPGGLDGLLT
jgi:hypothetical protein